MASPLTVAASVPAAAKRILALGDSYTIGEGVDDGGRWPQQLVAALRRDGVAVDDPRIVARTGWTTDELAAAMDAAAFDPPYDLVTLLVGVNNQYRATEGTGHALDRYRDEFAALLERAIALAGGAAAHVVVISIPDWGVTRFGRESGRDTTRIARAIDAFNAVNRSLAATRHVHYADVTPASRDGADRKDMLVADGLHPSAAMYARWLGAIAPPARAALGAG
jgi:lysophospholipase L1-like esterase